MSQETRPNGKFTLILVVLVFCAPVLLAWYMHAFTNVVATTDTTNHGDLVVPARLVPDLPLSNPGVDPDTDRLRGKWNLVFIQHGTCAQLCRENIYRMHRIYLATGRHAHRLRRVLMLDRPQDAGFHRYLQAYPGQRVYLAEQTGGEDVTRLFDLTGEMAVRQKGWFYIVDPLGNLMMSYRSEVHPKLIIKDLITLLRTSRIG